MAARNSGKQGDGVYFVCPLSSATFAASLMNAGVSKSGSPAPKPTTSTPAFFSALAFAVTARVIESDTSFIRLASGNMRNSVGATLVCFETGGGPYRRAGHTASERGPWLAAPLAGRFSADRDAPRKRGG